MGHDFIQQPGISRTCSKGGSSCTNIGGVMDYNQVQLILLKKTQKSKWDLKDFFNLYTAKIFCRLQKNGHAVQMLISKSSTIVFNPFA